MNPPRPDLYLILADAIADARGPLAAPAALLVESQPFATTVLAVGRPSDVAAHPAAPMAQPLPRPGCVLIPGLVNAHTHLDLTHIGPRPHDPDGGFHPWIDLIRAHRHADDAAIAAAVHQGIALLRAGGVVAVGDIAGAPKATPNLTPFRTLRDSGLLGVSYLEFFGIGRSWPSQPERLAPVIQRALDESAPAARVRFGLQPHAPTTVDIRLYQWAVGECRGRGLPLSTHLAETPEEHRFVAAADGPQREFLERLGLWDGSILEHLGRGRTPVAHLAPILAQFPTLVAHVNDADDAAIETLAHTGASVAYCPRASAYFAAHRHFGPHRYRDMLGAGVNVCLGTDSIVNIPPEAASRLSTLDEMRFLHQRDAADPAMLLAMATTNGARALGLDPALFLFQPGSLMAGIVAVPAPGPDPGPLRRLLRSPGHPELLFDANGSCLTRKNPTQT